MREKYQIEPTQQIPWQGRYPSSKLEYQRTWVYHMASKTTCQQFIKLVISFYWLCVIILWWCFDYIAHFRINSSTFQNTDQGRYHSMRRESYTGYQYTIQWHILVDLCTSLGTLWYCGKKSLTWVEFVNLWIATHRVTPGYPRYSLALTRSKEFLILYINVHILQLRSSHCPSGLSWTQCSWQS